MTVFPGFGVGAEPGILVGTRRGSVAASSRTEVDLVTVHLSDSVSIEEPRPR